MPRRIDSAPLPTSVRQQIERMITEQGLAGRRLLSYRKLAEKLGVCQQTLQRALAAMEAGGLIERRHGSGTYVLDAKQRRARAAARSLVVVIRGRPDPDAGWNPVSDMLAGVQAQAERTGTRCELLAWEDPGAAGRLFDAREMRAHAGFILLRLSVPRLVSRLLAVGSGPVAMVDEPLRGVPAILVGDDSINGAREVTRHLLELGHRRIGFLDVGDRQQWNPDKHGGYLAALEEAGVPVDERLTVAPMLGVPVDSAQAPRLVDAAVGELLALADPPTAIFAYDDRRALLVIESLRRRGIEPGRDISVAGFGDTASRNGTCDALTSCRIDFRKMGQEAVRALLRPATPGEGRFILVPDRLAVRTSTAVVKRENKVLTGG
ncbi:MAG TPA: substrate-binding domain-containing protein [Planctomycetota bacterium]|nr:substrate-binding domain-containing protein [Planctomycetota bacterium]